MKVSGVEKGRLLTHGGPQLTLPRRSSLLPAAPWLAPAVAAVAGAGPLLWSLPRGLDLTDEGYYLTEIAHPGDTKATALLFGWVWHPAYIATGGSVTGLRLVAFILVATLSVALLLAVVELHPPPYRPGWLTVVCLAAVTAGLALVPLSSLPATPSYNTLAWLALATAAIGCAWAWSGRRPVLGGCLVGLSGFLAVTAKPTTALALAIAVAVTTPWRRTGPRPVLAAMVALIITSGLLIALAPGHLQGLVDVVRRGVEATVGHAHLVRRDPFSFPEQVLLPLALAGLGGAAAGWAARRRPTAATLTGGVSVLVATVSLWEWARVGLTASIDVLLPFAAFTGFGVLGVASAVAARRQRASTGPGSLAARLAALLALLPAAYALGTNNNLWHWAGQAVAFWFLAIVLMVGTRGPLAAAAGGLAAYTALVAAVITPVDPYRGVSLTATQTTRVSREGAILRLPPAEARAVTAMLAVGDRLAVTRKTPVLDLTGASPGVIWAWGGRPVGSAWVVGGYPDSVEAARVAISPSRCDLSRALLLWAPGQRRALPNDVLAPWGVRVPDDYRAVARFPRATAPANPRALVETVTVLEPVRVTIPGCPVPRHPG